MNTQNKKTTLSLHADKAVNAEFMLYCNYFNQTKFDYKSLPTHDKENVVSISLEVLELAKANAKAEILTDEMRATGMDAIEKLRDISDNMQFFLAEANENYLLATKNGINAGYPNDKIDDILTTKRLAIDAISLVEAELDEPQTAKAFYQRLSKMRLLFQVAIASSANVIDLIRGVNLDAVAIQGEFIPALDNAPAIAEVKPEIAAIDSIGGVVAENNPAPTAKTGDSMAVHMVKPFEKTEFIGKSAYAVKAASSFLTSDQNRFYCFYQAICDYLDIDRAVNEIDAVLMGFVMDKNHSFTEQDRNKALGTIKKYASIAHKAETLGVKICESLSETNAAIEKKQQANALAVSQSMLVSLGAQTSKALVCPYTKLEINSLVAAIHTNLCKPEKSQVEGATVARAVYLSVVPTLSDITTCVDLNALKAVHESTLYYRAMIPAQSSIILAATVKALTMLDERLIARTKALELDTIQANKPLPLAAQAVPAQGDTIHALASVSDVVEPTSAKPATATAKPANATTANPASATAKPATATATAKPASAKPATAKTDSAAGFVQHTGKIDGLGRYNAARASTLSPAAKAKVAKAWAAMQDSLTDVELLALYDLIHEHFSEQDINTSDNASEPDSYSVSA